MTKHLVLLYMLIRPTFQIHTVLIQLEIDDLAIASYF